MDQDTKNMKPNDSSLDHFSIEKPLFNFKRPMRNFIEHVQEPLDYLTANSLQVTLSLRFILRATYSLLLLLLFSFIRMSLCL
jgi:hypothetical protein